MCQTLYNSYNRTASFQRLIFIPIHMIGFFAFMQNQIKYPVPAFHLYCTSLKGYLQSIDDIPAFRIIFFDGTLQICIISSLDGHKNSIVFSLYFNLFLSLSNT